MAVATIAGPVAVDKGGGLTIIGKGLRWGIDVDVGGSTRALATFAGLSWGVGTGGWRVGEIELDGFRRGLGRGSLLWGGGAGGVYTCA